MMSKIKTFVLALVVLTGAAHLGFSTNEIVPPALVKLDNQYFDGALLNGLDKVGQAGIETFAKATEFLKVEFESVLSDIQDGNQFL